MNDETTRFDAGSEGTPGPGTTTESTTGFCQDCGKPVTATTARPVGSAVFCEPCLQTRLGKQAAGAGYTPGYVPVSGPSIEKLPSPFLAGLLSVIPGVGQVYNGQYVKGIVILLICAILDSLGKNNHLEIFGVAAFAWWIYQIVDAYQTAKARVEGRPLPNPLELNDIGDRLGFGKGFGTSAATRAAAHGAAPVTPPPPASSQTMPTAETAPSTGWAPVNQNPVAAVPPTPPAYPDWVGYVPPAAVSPYAATPSGASPYTAATTGYAQTPPAAAPYQAYVPPVTASDYATASSSRSFPVIAIVLIVLGALFVMLNFVPDMHLSASWLVAILLGLFAALAFARRLGHLGGVSYRGNLVCAMRGPILLAVLAVLFLLQAVHAATLGQTWPVILLALGAILLLERTVGTPSTSEPAMTYAAATTYAAASASQETSRSEVSGNDVEKGGL